MMQAYSASPMCGTSRFTTITGKYASRAAYARSKATNANEEKAPVVIQNTKLEDLNGMNDCSHDNIAAIFQRNGYATSMIGKWHLSEIRPKQYDYKSAVNKVKACGFTHVSGLYVENLARGKRAFNNYSDGSFSHNMEWITYEATEFIDESANNKIPFFLYFNPTVPHSSNSVTKALKKFSCRATPSGFLDSEPEIEGMTGKNGCKYYRDTILQRGGGSEDDYGAIWLDDSVGALFKALEKNGILNDTIFLFQNDHGMDAKASLYEVR